MFVSVVYACICVMLVTGVDDSCIYMPLIVLTVVQAAGKVLGRTYPIWYQCSKDHFPGYPMGPLYPYRFSGNFGQVASPTEPSGWTIQ